MIEYTTDSGARLKISRVSRQIIDEFLVSNPMPEPPTEAVAAWGDIEEELPILDDPEYQERLVAYYLNMAREQVNLIAPAISIENWSDEMQAELADLEAIGVTSGNQQVDYLRFIATSNERELAAVIAMVLYNSTVTRRGIAEAERAFNVTWNDKPVLAWNIPGTPGRQGDIYSAREAARFAGLTWGTFSAMWGPEQSAVVAHYQIRERLAWLMSKQW